jgi:hypothetical protein
VEVVEKENFRFLANREITKPSKILLGIQGYCVILVNKLITYFYLYITYYIYLIYIN